MVTTASTKETSFLAALSREPRRILLRSFVDCVSISRPPGSFTSHPSGEDGFASCANDGVCGATPMEAGRALEPGQRLSTGPWVQTKLVFVSVKTLRQAAQAALDVLGPTARPSSVFSTISDSCENCGELLTSSSTTASSVSRWAEVAPAIFSNTNAMYFIVCFYNKYDHVVRQLVLLPDLTTAAGATWKWVLYTTCQEVQVRYNF